MVRQRQDSDSSTTSSTSSSSSSSGAASEHSKEEEVGQKTKGETAILSRNRNHREEATHRSPRELERRQSDNRERKRSHSPRGRRIDTREPMRRRERDERDREWRRERSPARERRRRSPHDEEPRHKVIKYEEADEEVRPKRRIIEMDERAGIGRANERHAFGGMRAFGDEREDKLSSRLGPRPQNRRNVHDRLGIPEDNPDLPQSGLRSMVAGWLYFRKI